MATNNKTSALIDNLLPEFLEDEGPKFQAFIRAYYEWLETTNQVTDRSKNLLNYQDIDKTADEFLDYFKNEVLSNFPYSILANKSLVYKRIKDLYKAKGTEEAYRLLFRILYDEEIDFYYPGDDILRASDGRWVQENSLRISAPFVGNPIDLLSKNITGATSGATAKVNRVTTTLESGVDVFELFVDNIVGTFQDSEQIQDSDGLISGFLINSFGPLTGVQITFGGSGHQLGDALSFNSSSGVSANGNVVRTIDNSLNVTVANGGSGYLVGTRLIITGGGGSGASFSVATVSNTEVIKTFDDIVSDLQNTRIDANTYITSNSGAISSNLAISNSSSILSAALGTTNNTVGTISSLTFTSRGGNYISLPNISARADAIADQLIADGSGGIKGFNATFNSERVAGALAEVSINEPGSGYNRSDPITIVNNSRSATDAIGAPNLTGIINYPGAYVDTRGFLSWNNKLQDNYFYQEFSYVIRSSKAISVYRELAKTVNHPAGMKLFGEARVEANVSFAPTIVSEVDLTIENLQGLGPLATIGTPTVTYTIVPTSITSTESFENDHSVIPNIDPVSITSSEVVSTDIEIDMFLGGAGLISIASTTTIPTHEVLQLGAGTISNFQANNIGDLSATQISEYDALTIDTLPGNRIIDGISTNFTGQLSAGTTLLVQHPLQELSITVGNIDDANTLSITSNAVFSNGDIVLFSGNTYFYT